MADDWSYETWPDGVEQWHYTPAKTCLCTVERVVGPKSRRKLWRVVDRRGWAEVDVRGMYPAPLSKPFKSLDQAKVMFLILLAAGQLD